jgi:hypothetical protein
MEHRRRRGRGRRQSPSGWEKVLSNSVLVCDSSGELYNYMQKSPFVKSEVHRAGQKLPDFYKTPTLIAVFTRARHWSLS